MAEVHRTDWSPPAWTDYLLVALVAGAVVFWRLGSETLTNHEAKLGLVARGMTSSDEWLVPSDKPYTIPPPTTANRWLVPVENGRPRLRKTPLPYWAAAATAMVYREFGGSGPPVNSVTVRVHSAISAVLCALIVLALGRRMFSQRAALLAALLFVTCIGFQKWSHRARPEMMLCVFVTASMAAFYCGIEATSRRRHLAWMVAFWLLVGLGNLAKQFVPLMAAWPVLAYLFWRQSAMTRSDAASLTLLRAFLIATGVGLAAVILVSFVPAVRWWRPAGVGDEAGMYLTMAAAFGLPMCWYFIVCRGWRGLLPLLPTALPGLVVAVAMFAWWVVYMLHLFPKLGMDLLTGEVTDRAAGVGRWQGVASPLIYLRSLVIYTLPWLALLPGACAVALMRRFERHRGGLVYLLLWCVGFVALFSASAGKRDHYILPMLPAMCLLMGFVAEDVFFVHAWIRPRLARWIGLGYAPVGLVGVAVAVSAYFISGRRDQWLHGAILAGAVTLPVAFAGWMIWRQRFRAGLAVLLASATLMYVGYYNWMRVWDFNRPAAELAASAAEMIPSDEPAYSWTDPQAKTVFYFGRQIPAVGWPLQRQDRNRPSSEVMEIVGRRLRSNPGEAPWLFAYDKHLPILEKLGYRCVLDAQGKPGSGEVFVLCRRKPVEAPTSPASGPTSAPSASGDHSPNFSDVNR